MTPRSIRRAAERKAKKQELKKLKAMSQSTGPITPEGKAIASQNSTKHGTCSSKFRLLENESMHEFKSLEALWFEGYKPQNAFETDLVHKAIQADWLARRADRHYADLEVDLFTASPNLIDWTPEQHKLLALANRYRTANNNALTKARKAIEDYRKNRRAEAPKVITPKPEPDLDFEGEDDIAKELEWMRKEAIRLGYANPDGTPTGKKD